MYVVEKIMVKKFMVERFMGLESSIWLWCWKFQSWSLELKIPPFYTKYQKKKMGAECLIYKCFQVTLPTLPCNQLPYLQSTSVGEKSAFPRLANLLVSRHVYSSAVRNTVHSAFWPVEIHDKEWCYRWWWSASNEVVILPLQFGRKIVLRMKSIYLQHKLYSLHI